jgi:hypothetical protein
MPAKVPSTAAAGPSARSCLNSRRTSGNASWNTPMKPMTTAPLITLERHSRTLAHDRATHSDRRLREPEESSQPARRASSFAAPDEYVPGVSDRHHLCTRWARNHQSCRFCAERAALPAHDACRARDAPQSGHLGSLSTTPSVLDHHVNVEARLPGRFAAAEPSRIATRRRRPRGLNCLYGSERCREFP